MKCQSLFFALIASLLLSACAVDDGSDCFSGKWKVSQVDMQSTKLSPTIVEMTKLDYNSYQYEFMDDNKLRITSKLYELPMEGTWKFDKATQELQWTIVNTSLIRVTETSKLVSCTEGEIVISMRVPNDTAKDEMATLTMTWEKIAPQK
jgi:hypothetical protein